MSPFHFFQKKFSHILQRFVSTYWFQLTGLVYLNWKGPKEWHLVKKNKKSAQELSAELQLLKDKNYARLKNRLDEFEVG